MSVKAYQDTGRVRQVEEATVLEHVDFGGGYRRIVLHAPRIAAASAPGQFVHMRILQMSAESLRRPFSIYRAHAPELHLMYKPVGRGTQFMVHVAAGDRFSLIGPLGRGFPMDATATHPVLVAGGYGVAPLSFLAERLGARIGTVFIGGRTGGDILCIDDFARLGWEVKVTTEDGTAGSRGIVTTALDAWLEARPASPSVEIYGCGPEGLMQALSVRAARLGCRAWLSLDRPMGCGIGACLACVQRVRGPDGQETWARCCTEGPVFAAEELIWEPFAGAKKA